MLKLNLFIIFCFLLAKNISEDLSDEEISYNYFYNFFSGLETEKGQNKCSKVIKKHKAKFIKILENIIPKLRQGVNIDDILVIYGIEIVSIPGLAQYCNLLKMVPVYYNITENNVSLSDLFLQSSSKIYGLLKNATTDSERFRVFGEIISFLFNFKVK